MSNAWDRLRVSVAEMAGAWIWFPQRLAQWHPPDVDELGRALEQVGRDVRAGRLNGANSVAIPHPRRTRMKVEFEWEGPDGAGMDQTTNYKKLSVEYAFAIASVAQSFAHLISQTAGSAASSDPTYVVKFRVTGADLPEPHKAKGRIEATANDLLYSEMSAIQDAGLELFKQLQTDAHREIKSGQRK